MVKITFKWSKENRKQKRWRGLDRLLLHFFYDLLVVAAIFGCWPNHWWELSHQTITEQCDIINTVCNLYSPGCTSGNFNFPPPFPQLPEFLRWPMRNKIDFPCISISNPDVYCCWYFSKLWKEICDSKVLYLASLSALMREICISRCQCMLLKKNTPSGRVTWFRAETPHQHWWNQDTDDIKSLLHSSLWSLQYMCLNIKCHIFL